MTALPPDPIANPSAAQPDVPPAPLDDIRMHLDADRAEDAANPARDAKPAQRVPLEGAPLGGIPTKDIGPQRDAGHARHLPPWIDVAAVGVVTVALAVAMGYLVLSGVALEALLQSAIRNGPGAESSALDAREVIAYAMMYAIAWRRNATLLVGCTLALLGCIIVLLRVRATVRAGGTSAFANVNLGTDSAGLFICLLGALLVSSAALMPERYEYEQSEPSQLQVVDPVLDGELPPELPEGFGSEPSARSNPSMQDSGPSTDIGPPRTEPHTRNRAATESIAPRGNDDFE